jgi:tripartite-type tricarboxylate transporter receptor subunit TctC
VAWAKSQKAPVPFGSGSAASVGHIVGARLAQETGLKMLHIPYRGAGPMRTDLLGGQLKVAVDALPANLQFRKTGQLRLVAQGFELEARSPVAFTSFIRDQASLWAPT